MEDGKKQDPAQQNEPKFLSKAGWVKKAQGRLLTSYKERFVHVEKTEVVVYENEDLQNCLLRIDLENYETCHELKSPFKKRHRLILIRSPKPGNKVHDLRFQVQTAEEKEAWIKALSDCISRAKNKVFDEVKVDESRSLEHVTRSRPKANRNRRPPTRIHMKEVAGVSSDGILRLDLDLEDAVMPNGTQSSTDGSETSKPANTSGLRPDGGEGAASSGDQEAQDKPEDVVEKKVIKPPMPPTKVAKTSSVSEDEKEDGAEKKVLRPPMPPSKEAKPCPASPKADSEDQKPDAKKKSGPPPTPPHKPNSSGSISNLTEDLQSHPLPPEPPSKEKKPVSPTAESPQKVTGTSKQETLEGSINATVETGVQNDEKDGEVEIRLISANVSTERKICWSGQLSDSDHGEAEESQRGSPSSPLNPQTVPEKPAQHEKEPSADTQTNEGLETSLQNKLSSEVFSDSDPLTTSSLLCHLAEEKKNKEEEKSVDSGQHSDDDSEDSGSEDPLAASTLAHRGSHPCLDVLDGAEPEIQARPNGSACRLFEKPPKPVVKPRASSIGDLLSASSSDAHPKPSSKALKDDVMKLETEVAQEMVQTSELLNQAQDGNYREGMPEDLLATALEKLKKADIVLKEVQKLNLTNKSNKRMSW